MVRIKNAITGYFVADWDAQTPPTAATTNLELGPFITSVTDDSDETVETTAFYDGDGTPQQDVTAIAKTYTFNGQFDDDDPGMAFIKTKEFTIGESRKIAFKQVRTDGYIYFGRATVSGIKTSGGEASDFPVFECAISWDKIPEITPPPGP